MIPGLRIYVFVLLISCGGAFAEERQALSTSELEIDEDGNPILNITLFPMKDLKKSSPFRFLLNTSTSLTILDRSIPSDFYWSEEGAVKGMDIFGKSIISPMVMIKRMEVAGITKDELPAILMDLKENTGRMQDAPVDGILGMNFLRDTRFILDLKGRRLGWWQKPSTQGVALPISFDQTKIPVVTLKINGREVSCTLATNVADGLGMPAGFRPQSQGKASVLLNQSLRKNTGTIVDIPKVEAGSGAWWEIPVHFQEIGNTGYIGLEIWSAAPTCFDFIEDTVTFEPGPDNKLQFERDTGWRLPLYWDRSGAGPRLRVLLVKQGSVLEEAREGDEILRVGPLKGKALTRRTIQEWTVQSKGETWTVRRKGKVVDIHVPPRLHPSQQGGGLAEPPVSR